MDRSAFCLRIAPYSTVFSQRRALRSALGLRLSTPNRVVYAEACEFPFSIRQKKLASKFILNALSVSDNPIIFALDILLDSLKGHNKLDLFNLPILRAFAHFKRYKHLLFSSPVLQCFTYSLESQHLSPNVILHLGHKIKKSANPALSFSHLFKSYLKDSVAFYTDGSKTAAGSYVGLAVVCPQLNLSFQFRIPSLASIFTAESLAIQIALEHILSSRIPNATIFTDSLSVLQAISQTSDFIPSSTTAIFKIKKLLLDLISLNCQVTLAWIPSHLGIPGNELVDSLAKEASSKGTSLDSPLPPSDLFPLVNTVVFSDFERFLLNYRPSTGIFYFSNCYSPSRKPWFHSSVFGRREITTFSRMRSNHYSLASSLHRKNLIDSPLCPTCQIEEDLNHIFWACPNYDNQRRILMRDLSKLKLFPPFIISSFLHPPDPSLISILLDFLSNCNLNI